MPDTCYTLTHSHCSRAPSVADLYPVTVPLPAAMIFGPPDDCEMRARKNSVSRSQPLPLLLGKISLFISPPRSLPRHHLHSLPFYLACLPVATPMPRRPPRFSNNLQAKRVSGFWQLCVQDGKVKRYRDTPPALGVTADNFAVGNAGALGGKCAAASLFHPHSQPSSS